MVRVLFVSYGSLGDIHPFLAIAQALCDDGVTCVFATNDSNVDVVRKAGFEAHRIVADPITLFEQAGLAGEAAVIATRENVNTFWRIVMPEFAGHLEELEQIARNAVAIIGPPWAFNAQSVAEKAGIAFIGAHLWPTTVLSATDPPILKDLPGLIREPGSKSAVAWNRFVIGCAKRVMPWLYSRYLNPPRRAYGLGALTRTPVLDFHLEPARVLRLYSPHFAPLPEDYAEEADLTGFPVMQDAPTLPEPDLELEEFLRHVPIVFTLGSILSQNPGPFYDASVAAAQALGLKALILTGKPELLDSTPNILVRGYVPHGMVFPHARVIVHHGGIGTTAQALLAGRPQLVVPHFGDQPDNAARLERLGVARGVPAQNYCAERAKAELSVLIRSPHYQARAQDLQVLVASENGARRAAQCVREVIDPC